MAAGPLSKGFVKALEVSVGAAPAFPAGVFRRILLDSPHVGLLGSFANRPAPLTARLVRVDERVRWQQTLVNPEVATSEK